MFRMIFAFVFCLGFAGSSQAFFAELLEHYQKEMLHLAATAEKIAHSYELKQQEHKDGLPESIAKELDKGLRTLKMLLDGGIKKIKKNTMLSEEFKNKILSRLVAVQSKLFHNIDEIQKRLDKAKDKDAEKQTDL